MSYKGIDLISGTTILFEESLKDSSGADLTTGDTFLFLYEVQADGTLKTFDFNDWTFKATACTDDEIAMTHRQGNNGTVNTGVWTYVLSTVSGFTVGNKYIAKIVNSGAMPVALERKFQWGGNQEDISGIADAIWDEATSGHTGGNTYGRQVKDLHEVIAIADGTAQDGGDTTITLQAGESVVTDFYKGMLCVLLGGTGAGQARAIIGYNGTTKVATIGPAWATNPDVTSEYALLSFGSTVVASIDAAATAQIKTAIEAAGSHLALIKAQSDKLQFEAVTNYLQTVPQNFEDVDVSEDASLTAGKAGQRLRDLYICLIHKLVITEATGSASWKKQDDSTEKYTGTITSSSGQTIRTRMG